LARDGSAASRLTRRANALVLLDDGWSCQEVAAALLLNDDTIRGWHKLFEQRGIHGAIRRSDFEFRLDKMSSHGIFPSKCSRTSCRIIRAVRAPTDRSALCVADRLASTGGLSKMRINCGRGIL
jgi:Winged helix-turn helix